MVDSAGIEKIISWFPDLSHNYFRVTSPCDGDYNCIAWAAGENDRWWWPQTAYWPDNVPEEITLAAFISAYQTLGYELCDNDRLDPGFNKVAIYLFDNGRPSHAARQLANGNWTSKLGNGWDIEHTLEGLVGQEYGHVRQILKREKK